MTDWGYFDKFHGVIEKYMPDRGEGDTMASQIVTAVNKLVYKAYNDGDVYDNTHYLPGWANDLSSYANWLFKNVGSIAVNGILRSIEDCLTMEDYEDLLRALADNTLGEWFLEGFEKREKVGSIYECDGPFKFEWRDDEEDEEC